MDYFDIVMATIGWTGLLYVCLVILVQVLFAWLLYTLIWRAVRRGIREAARDERRKPLSVETMPISPIP